jgi:hypothetical protein
MLEAGESVEHGIDIGTDSQAEVRHVIAGVDDDRQGAERQHSI